MQKKTVNQFLKEMAEVGFTGNFVATNNQQTYKGTINADKTISVMKVQTVEESKRKIRELLR
jgi:hypothetical protein